MPAFVFGFWCGACGWAIVTSGFDWQAPAGAFLIELGRALMVRQ